MKSHRKSLTFSAEGHKSRKVMSEKTTITVKKSLHKRIKARGKKHGQNVEQSAETVIKRGLEKEAK